jgi:TRAP-type mannitol/chloroaromatic compound transport system substrate-binding protein
MGANFDYANPVALRRLVSNATQLRAFPSEVLQACGKPATMSTSKSAPADHFHCCSAG